MPPKQQSNLLAPTNTTTGASFRRRSNNNNNNNNNNSPPTTNNNTVSSGGGLQRTASNANAFASNIKNAFARTNSTMNSALLAEAEQQKEKSKQQENTTTTTTDGNNNTDDSNKTTTTSRSSSRKKRKNPSDPTTTSTTAGKPRDAASILADNLEEEIAKFVGNAFEPLPEDQNADDAIDDLLPNPKNPARLQLRGHADSVRSCCFDPHHRLLFTASWDGLVLVWNLEMYSSPIARLQHREWVNAVAITYVPDMTVISITEDGYMFGWQCEQFMVEKELKQQVPNNNNNPSTSNPAASSAASANTTTNPLFSHHKKFEVVAQIQVSYGALTCLAIHSDFNFAFCSSGDTTFGIHLSSGSILREYVTATEATNLATVDAVLCISQKNGTITLYDVVGSFVLRELTGHRGAVRCISVIDSYTIMSAGDDGSVRVWNIASGACQSHRRRVHTRAIVAISHFYTDRDRMVVTAGLDGVVKVTRQSNGASVSSFGLLCNCFCIVPPLPVDPSSVEDVIELLTSAKAVEQLEKLKERQMLEGNNLWEEQPLQYTASVVSEMRTATLVDQMTAPQHPLRVPGTEKVVSGSSITRHARWSFFQTLICGGPTGRLTRLSLEAAVSKDAGSDRPAFSY